MNIHHFFHLSLGGRYHIRAATCISIPTVTIVQCRLFCLSIGRGLDEVAEGQFRLSLCPMDRSHFAQCHSAEIGSVFYIRRGVQRSPGMAIYKCPRHPAQLDAARLAARTGSRAFFSPPFGGGTAEQEMTVRRSLDLVRGMTAYLCSCATPPGLCRCVAMTVGTEPPMASRCQRRFHRRDVSPFEGSACWVLFRD